jgi:hypothetical protein
MASSRHDILGSPQRGVASGENVTPGQLIALLNSMSCGDLEALSAKLAEAGKECATLGQDDLEQMLAEARDALLSADLKTYRKRVETVVARLGHLKPRSKGTPHPGGRSRSA